MKFQNLMEIAKLKLCDYRNIMTLLERPDFQKCHDACTEVEQDKVHNLILAGAHEVLRVWFRGKNHEDLGDKSVRDLRQIASTLAIPDYARLKKSVLLSEIVKRQTSDPKRTD